MTASPPTDAILQTFRQASPPLLTTNQVADKARMEYDAAYKALTELYQRKTIERRLTADGDAVWLLPSTNGNKKASLDAQTGDRSKEEGQTDSEEDTSPTGTDSGISCFPARREFVLHNPDPDKTQALSKLAHLVDGSGSGKMFKIDREDVWSSPYDTVDEYVDELQDFTPTESPHLEQTVHEYWERQEKFTLETHPEGYTVLAGESKEAMENIARRHLSNNDHYVEYVSETEWRVKRGAEADVKQTLYEAGYLVRDNRVLEKGDTLSSLEFEPEGELHEHQQEWRDTFIEQGSGVFVGASGSGKTVGAIATMCRLQSETLIIVPRREMATQWKDELCSWTSLTEAEIGIYHGRQKSLGPVTITTYDTAGKSRHRSLFQERDWGLVVTDEAHHTPAPIWKRAADIQSKRRLGLTATPVRESGNSKEIYTLLGPPIGGDWERLFTAGEVAEPEVTILRVPWASDSQREQYQSKTNGMKKMQAAAMNPEKVNTVDSLLTKHAGQPTLIFVEWIDQGKYYSEQLDIPFIHGETSHEAREERYQAVRDGEIDSLIVSRIGDEGIDLPDVEVCIIASTLGSSRSQTSQRVGRTMRPVGSAIGYILPTKGTTEIDYVRQSTEYLSEKGVKVSEVDADSFLP